MVTLSHNFNQRSDKNQCNTRIKSWSKEHPNLLTYQLRHSSLWPGPLFCNVHPKAANHRHVHVSWVYRHEPGMMWVNVGKLCFTVTVTFTHTPSKNVKTCEVPATDLTVGLTVLWNPIKGSVDIHPAASRCACLQISCTAQAHSFNNFMQSMEGLFQAMTWYSARFMNILCLMG